MKLKLMFLIVFLLQFCVCGFCANDAIRDAQNAVVGIFRDYNEIDELNGRKDEGPVFVASGFFINEDGYFLTCYHCLSMQIKLIHKEYSFVGEDPDLLTGKLETFFIKTNDNKRIVFKCVDFDMYKDLALCKIIENVKVQYVPLADSQKVLNTDHCYAIGTPQDKALKNTITDGIISSTDRTDFNLNSINLPEAIKKLFDFSYLQHSAPITGGNSGGPLLNESGACIGINCLQYKGQDSYGMAICINHVKSMLERNNVNYTRWDPNRIVYEIQIDKDGSRIINAKDKKIPVLNIKNDGDGDYIEYEGEKLFVKDKEPVSPDYTIYIVIGIVLFVIIVFLVVFLIVSNKNKSEKQKNNAYYSVNNQYKTYNQKTIDYSSKSKDNYDDIDIEFF